MVLLITLYKVALTTTSEYGYRDKNAFISIKPHLSLTPLSALEHWQTVSHVSPLPISCMPLDPLEAWQQSQTILRHLSCHPA